MRKNRKNTLLLGQDDNALTWLIIINTIVFVVINFIKIIYFLSYDSDTVASLSFNEQILNWFSLSPDLGRLATRPWTIVTYMFSHEGIWQLIGTLLWLWGFGYIFQDLTGNSKLMPVYLYGGFAGAFVFVSVSNFIPQYAGVSATLLGGGSAVMAVAVATTAIAPGYRIFPMINGGIPLWVLTLIFVAIDYATIASGGGAFALAHLAGGMIGFVFVQQMQKGRDWGAWMIDLMDWINDLFNPEKKFKKKDVPQHDFYKTSRKPFEKTPHITQQRLDALLDKINQDGYRSLTEEEKTFLKKASQEDI